MIIIFITAPVLICAVVYAFQAVIHETGHYLAIKKWSRRLNWETSGTTVYIGEDNSRVLLKLGDYRFMSKGFFKTGVTVSPFYKRLALYNGKDRDRIIRNNAVAGAIAVLISGFLPIYILLGSAIICFRIFTPLTLAFFLPLVMLTAIFAFIVFKNSFGADNGISDLSFWCNPQKFIDYFKN